MARYREKILPVAPASILLAFIFLLIFQPWSLGERELSWHEGYIVTLQNGMEMAPPLVKAHGEAVPNMQPLFPLFSAAATALGCPVELSSRVISLVALAGLTVLVFMVAYRTRSDVSAGACAGAMMISSVLVIDKAVDGVPESLLALLLLGGQLIWYYFAAVRGNWTRAWLAGFITCAVGFYLNGLPAVILFLVPLIFMRRPLGIFRKLGNRGVMLGLGILFLTILLWYLPYHLAGGRVAAVYPQMALLDGKEYLCHLLFFPWDFALRLLPWALLAWAPYCVAIQSLDDTPMFSRFLRTVFLTDFFLLWLIPADEKHSWLILVPPLAIMTALNYSITVRRYGNFFRKLCNIAAWVLMPLSAAALLTFFLLPADLLTGVFEPERSLAFSDEFGRTVLGTVSGAMLLITALILWKMREKPPVWCYFMLVVVAPVMVYNNIVLPYQSQERPRQERAEILRQALDQDGAPQGVLIYKYGINDLFTESVYLGSPVEKVASLNNLPGAEQPVVYLFAESFPECAERSWRSLVPGSLVSRNQKFNLWRGSWQENLPAERKESPLLEEIRKNPDGRGGAR